MKDYDILRGMMECTLPESEIDGATKGLFDWCDFIKAYLADYEVFARRMKQFMILTWLVN